MRLWCFPFCNSPLTPFFKATKSGLSASPAPVIKVKTEGERFLTPDQLLFSAEAAAKSKRVESGSVCLKQVKGLFTNGKKSYFSTFCRNFSTEYKD